MNFKHAWFRGGPLMKQDITLPIEMVAGTVVPDNSYLNKSKNN